MKRRDFLRYSALGGLALSTSGLLAHAMAGRRAGHADSAALMPPTALPQGQPLQALPRIANLSERSGLFQATLTPAPHGVPLEGGREARLWLYNGEVTPLIEVSEGDEFDVTLSNALEEETTLHWHGVPVPRGHDGAPWDAVAPGGSRRYRYAFAEGSAGLHWFHPHPHGNTAGQIAHGLTGALLVRPRREALPEGVEEHLLMISDLRLDEAGDVAPHRDVDWMNGREGELLLVNGQRRPRLDVAPGTTLRLRLINACAGRYLRLRLDEHALTLIGTDGGPIARPRPLDELLLVPGERADLLVRMSEESGRRFTLASHPYERGWMGERPAHLDEVAPLLDVRTRGDDLRPAVALPSRLGEVVPLGEPAVRRRVELSEAMRGGGRMEHGGGHVGMGQGDGHGDHGGMRRTDAPAGHGGMAMSGPDGAPGVDFLINGRVFAMGEVLFEGEAGVVEEWEVVNDSHMDHPFHIHGTHFQVVASREAAGEWRDAPWLAWKDTVNLAPGQRLRLRLAFREPGDWLFHCHIIEHEALGMMATIRIR